MKRSGMNSLLGLSLVCTAFACGTNSGKSELSSDSTLKPLNPTVADLELDPQSPAYTACVNAANESNPGVRDSYFACANRIAREVYTEYGNSLSDPAAFAEINQRTKAECEQGPEYLAWKTAVDACSQFKSERGKSRPTSTNL
ncbi:MAG: hypothetical protein M3Q07_10415 [Pseudobdellovibrionaceae bacterium]|nr:hypothetical protein [Pseudobdellovibrionaceae bacterium]